jgi:VanZ family protein
MTRLLTPLARHWLPLTFALLAAIVTLSLTPLPELPLPEVDQGDKLHHLVAYAALAFPVSLAGPPGWPRWIVGFLLFGAAIELVQPYANRYGEIADWAANAAGVTIGALAGRAAARRLPLRL